MSQLKRCLLLVVLALAHACAAPTPIPSSPTPLPTATDTVAPSPTARPPTATPTNTHTPAPTLTPTATADPRESACDHDYWPLRAGASWEHQLTTGRRLQTITGVTGDLQSAEVTLDQLDPDGSRQVVQLLCSPEGITYGDATVTRPDGRVSVKTVTAHEGWALVSAEQLLAGATWQWSQTADFDAPAYTDGVYTGQSQFTTVSEQACQALGMETVTVSLGTFDAIPVECAGETVSTTAAGTSATFPFNSTAYYVVGLGSLNPAEGAPELVMVNIHGSLALALPPQTACDHLFWPLRAGATWEYTDGSANWTQAVTEVTGDTDQATATLVTRYASGDSVTFTYECNAAGLVLAETDTDFGGVQSTSILTSTGVHLVGPESFAPGATWRLESEQDFSSSTGQASINPLLYDYAVQNSVTIDTTAGAFLSLPVTIAFTSTTTTPGQPLTTTHWYAAGVGLVYADIGGQTKWDLVSFALP